MKHKTLLVTSIIIIIFGYLFWKQFIRDDFDLPRGGETSTEIIIIENGEVVGIRDSSVENSPIDDSPIGNLMKEEIKKTNSEGVVRVEKEIFVTDGVKHSVPLNEILGGGPPKDGIPSIDDPKFITISEAREWIKDDEPGIAFSRNGEHRFYPFQILVWHEIVNDIVGGERILVTYCPLCLTATIFDPLVDGERVEFGTSGKLWKSNLVMYDRKTDSLWSQVLAESILGEKTGSVLTFLPSDQMLFREWSKKFPTGEVLSRDTGATRFYGSSPYGDYFSVTNLSLSLANPTDTRLPNDAFVFGIVIDGKAKAYSVEAVKKKGEVVDVFEGTTISLRYDSELDVVRMYKTLSDGSEERINPMSGFWFSWAVARPETELYK